MVGNSQVVRGRDFRTAKCDRGVPLRAVEGELMKHSSMSGVILTWLHHDVAALASILGPMSSSTLADSQWPNEPL